MHWIHCSSQGLLERQVQLVHRDSRSGILLLLSVHVASSESFNDLRVATISIVPPLVQGVSASTPARVSAVWLTAEHSSLKIMLGQ